MPPPLCATLLGWHIGWHDTQEARQGGDDPLEKTGYRIPRSVVAMAREAVDAGEARSQNEFVERAVRRELRAVEQRRLYDEYALAAADAGFTADMERVERDFRPALGDGLGPEDV